MEKEILYKYEVIPSTAQIIEVYESSGIIRHTSNLGRIESMYGNSNLVVTAWQGDSLIGIARALTDFCYSCYLADLAVKKDFQKKGVGRKLIAMIKEKVGPQTSLLLLSAPDAMKFYPKAGFDEVENGFIIKRTE